MRGAKTGPAGKIFRRKATARHPTCGVADVGEGLFVGQAGRVACDVTTRSGPVRSCSTVRLSALIAKVVDVAVQLWVEQ